MNANKKPINFKRLMVAIAILIFPGFLGTAEAQPQGPPNLDANGDGVITFEEASVLRFMDEEHFKRLDANGDGVLSQEEQPQRRRRGRRGKGRRGFANVDANDDGVLSQEELPPRHRRGRRGKGRRGFGWLDTDGDGMVTFEEASAPRMDEGRFKSLDANGDGMLSQEELPQRHRRGHRGKGRRGFGWLDKSGDDTAPFDKASMPPCVDEEYFKRLDTNSDGVLSQEELPPGCRLAPRGGWWR